MIRVRVLANVPYAWKVVALWVVAIISLAFVYMGFGALYPFIQEDLKLSRAQLGLISSGMFVGGTATVLFLGWLVDVVGVRRLELLSLLGVAVGLVLFSQMQSLVQAILAALFIGIASSSSLPSQTKAIMDWVPPKGRGLAMGIIESSITICGIIAAVLFTALAVSFGWREAIVSLAVLTALSGVVFFTFYRDRAANFAEGEKRSSLGRRVPLVLKNREIWLVAWFGAALTGIWTIIVSYLILFLKEELGESAGVAAGLFSIVLAGAAAGRIVWGLISDLLLRGRRVVTIAMMGVLSVPAMALLTWLPSNAHVVLVGLVLFIVGATTLAWTGLWPLLIAELVGPGLTGTAMGLANTIQRLAAFGIAPLFGLIVDRTGSYDLGWWMAAGVAGAGTLSLFFLRPQTRRL